MTTDLADARFEGSDPIRFTFHGQEYEARPGTLLTGGDWVVQATTISRSCTLTRADDGTWTAVSHSDFPHTANAAVDAVELALTDD